MKCASASGRLEVLPLGAMEDKSLTDQGVLTPIFLTVPLPLTPIFQLLPSATLLPSHEHLCRGPSHRMTLAAINQSVFGGVRR